MSKRKNISKQDLKNIDLVLENDIQCSGVNIGGRAYEFVSGGYEVLELTGTSGTLTNAQYLDLVANPSIVILNGNEYYIFSHNDTYNNQLEYIHVGAISDLDEYHLKTILIKKTTKAWSIKSLTLQNQPLTISDVNAKLNVIRQKAQIINDVLYVSFRATAINEVSANETLFVISTDYKTTYNKYFNYYRDSGVLSSLTLVVAQGSYNTNITVTSGNTIDVELSILL